MLAWFLLTGARFFMVCTGALLPQFIVRRLGDPTYFALYLGINPLLIGILSFVAPLVPWLYDRGRHLHWIIIGLTLQFTSLGWLIWGGPRSTWSIVLFIVTSTLGEVASWTRVDAWLMAIGLSDEMPHFRSAIAVPGAVLNLFGIVASGFLLNTYCGPAATPEQCDPVMWAWVAGIAATAPILMGLVGLGCRRLP